MRSDQTSEAYINDILIHLALNHSIVVGFDGKYSASSPDELALVNAAKYMGYEFKSRSTQDNSITIEVNGQQQQYVLLQEFEFTSSRKKMTSIFRTPDGRYLVLTKGADSTILPLCNYESDQQLKAQTLYYLESYAREGFRTLVFAQKTLSEKEFLSWNAEFTEAQFELGPDKQRLLEGVAAKLENNFYLTGSTAIEDKLQAGVPETISHIRKAGIKIWVLTGDKLETAVNIAQSSNLIDESNTLHVIDATSQKQLKRQLT